MTFSSPLSINDARNEPRPAPDYSVRGLNSDRLAAILAHAGTEVLDVGCGSGAYVLHLADQFHIRGVDYRHFDAWNRRPELFQLSDAQELKLPDASVDTILSFETLEHLPDPARALSEYWRVCRRNLILTVPNCQLTEGMRNSGVIFNHWIDRTHLNFWDIEGIAKLVTDAGFKVQHKKHINRINPGFLLMESLDLKGRIARYGAGLFRRLQRRHYFMTNLVVATKPEVR